ncbi:hypothetical protein [Mangrovibacillus cuniculi]|uniref:Multidrug ABC transporter permease n=1 Tax=Mangrovibacillus cuniculi TaxID=2593652 RepID=A0A7S8HF46_9BACI|nr:hypothetical protein [Mangrovibacillus cuniculi]QPC46534.1 hypothetical protein G8O30_05915 [Mangrovibacillus cuniculi]
MQSKTSLFSRAIIGQNIRSVTWLSVLYTIILLFAYPVAMLTIISNEYSSNTGEDLANYMQFGSFGTSVFLLIVPLIFSIVLFRYLHTPLASDYLHSLPFKRDTHFISNFICGLVGLIAPLIISSISILLVVSLNGYSDAVGTSDVLVWMATNILGHVLFYIIATFVLMITGLTFVNIVLYFIFIFYPFFITLLAISNMRHSILGFPMEYYIEESFEYLLYIATFVQAYTSPFTLGEWLTFSFMAAVLFALTWLAYRIRPLEVATQSIAFSALRPVILYGITFFFTLMFGAFFFETNGKDSWAYFGYVTGSFLGFTITEMVLQKSWRIGKSFRKLGVYMLVVVAMVIGLKLDITGFEGRVPEASEVKRVWFSEDQWAYQEFKRFEQNESEFYQMNINQVGSQFYAQPENVEAIVQLHEKILSENLAREYDRNYRPDDFRLFIIYELENGNVQSRLYTVPEKVVSEMLSPVLESSETKDMVDYFTDLEEKDYKLSDVRIGYPNGNSKFVSNDAEISSLLNAIQNDSDNLKGENRFVEPGYASNYYLEVTFKKKYKTQHTIYLEVYDSYKDTKKWIENFTN